MPFNLSITPAQLEILAKPNQHLTQTYQLQNNSSSPIFLSASIQQWQPNSTNQSPQYLPQTNTPVHFSLLNSNIKLNQPFSIPPRQAQQLILKIQLPNRLPESYFTLFLNQQNPYSTSTNSTQTTAKIGSHLFISTSNTDQIKHQAKIISFSTTPKIKDILFSKINLNLDLQNQSNYLFHSNGQLVITKNNHLFQQIPIFPHRYLAHRSRPIQCFNQQDTHPIPIQCTISPPFWPGLYTVNLELNSNVKISPTTASFFVLPISPLMFIFLISFLIYLLLKKTKTKT
ncbi:hypothetical protein DRH14_00240 [Candidatus Shapirobacteria bacterium]|nr:MAG: hypothetical protein DRH14_00240 [Candidatus Shapirobacteria bacterium]